MGQRRVAQTLRRMLGAGIVAVALVSTGIGMRLTSTTTPSTVPFAPYVDMTLPPVGNLASLATQAGIKSATLAFIVADGTSCVPSWGNYYPVGANNGEFQHEINSFVADGGQPIISFGGEINNELATVCSSPTALEAAYEQVINRYHVYSLDFDIEGAQLSNTTSVNKRNEALDLLQTAEAALGHTITISYTLPVLPTGLLANSLYLLRSAVTNHVKVSVVNVMAMDYGSANAPDPSAMGTYAIDAATATEAQLASIYPDLSTAQLWSMIGITPMIGQNDLAGEIFTTQNATQVADFAQSHDIGRLSYWELHRDVECANDADVDSNYCSGTTQTPYQFASIFGAVPATTSPSSPPPSTGGGGATTTPANLTLALAVSSSWYNGCNMAATVTNSGTSSVSSWTVGIALGAGDTITNIWNATLGSTTSSTSVTASNVSYNGTLAPGGTTSFGFQVAGDCTTVTPASTTSTPPPSSPPPSTGGGGTATTPANLTVHTTITSQWQGGYVVEATVTNSGTSSVSSWTVGIALGAGDTITNIWNATLGSTTSSTSVTASNVSYNGTLAPGGTTSFGFQVAGPTGP